MIIIEEIEQTSLKLCLDIIIPESIISIGDSAFSECENLSTVYNESDLIFIKFNKFCN